MNFLVVIHLAILVLVTGENHARYKRVDDLNDLRISLSSNDQQVLNNLGREIMDVQSALSKTKNYLGVMSIFGDDPMESLNSLVERFRNILLDLFSSLNIDTSVLNNFTKIFPVKEDYTTVEDFAGTIGSAIGAASGAALGAIIGAGLDYSTIGANIKVLTDFMTEMRKLLEDILGVFDGSLTETLDPLGIGKAIGDPIKSVIGSGSSILGLSRTEGTLIIIATIILCDESSEKNLKKSKSLIPSWILKK